MKAITFTIILLLGIFLFPTIIHSVKIDDKITNEINIKSKKESYIYNLAYEETIEYIKSHEGFNDGRAYRCAAGYKTIGYGHLVMRGEKFQTPMSKETADNLLRADFKKALNAVERNTNLTGRKKLAIAHFIFSTGIGNFNRSTLKKRIKAAQPIDKHILKWSNYTNTNGELIRSNYAYKIRQWELNMYNSDDTDFMNS